MQAAACCAGNTLQMCAGQGVPQGGQVGLQYIASLVPVRAQYNEGLDQYNGVQNQ